MAELTHETVKRLRERIIEMRSDGLMLWTHSIFMYIDQLEAQVAALKDQVERLRATVRSVDAMRMLQESRIHGLQTILTEWLTARAATPAIHPACDHEWRIDTGGECPKCAQPAPDGSSHD